MKNITTLLFFLLLPIFSFLHAQCFDLTIFDLEACPGEQVVYRLEISGGEAPYTVVWDTGFSQGEEIISQQDGAFDLLIDQSANILFTVTDNTQCEETVTGTVSFPPSIIATIDIINPIGCGGNCDGAAIINVVGGVAPYTFITSFGAISGPEIVNLCAGQYTVEIIDAIGCVEFISFVIEDASSIGIFAADITQVSCFGNSDGAIDISVTGGAPPYVYTWIGPNGFFATTEDLTNLMVGTYSLEILDAQGCLAPVFIVEITESGLLEINYSSSGLVCMDDGFIEVTDVIGGTPPFTYSLDGGSFIGEDLFENLIGGIYNLTVQDALGCTATTTVIIESDISLQINTTFADCDSLGGSAIVTDIVGATDPSYVWSNGDTGPEISDLAPGWYSVTVTDNESNCVTHQNVEILYDPGCFVRISGNILNDFDNEDCVEDGNSFPAEFVLVGLSNGDLTFTDETGYYEFEISPGTYEVSVDLGPTFYEPLCVEPITVAVTDFGDISSDNDFWVTYPSTQDLSINIFSGPVRPGFDQTVIVHARNLSGFPMDGNVTFSHDVLQTLIGAVPAANYDMSSATLSWTFEDLNPGEIISFVVELNLPPGTALGSPITYVGTIGPEENDVDLTNNIKEVNLNVTGSYDPNDKQVTPRGEGEEGNITRADSVLTYQVRFQNTGTDTAFTVVILDEISEDLDISSVQPGASSHPYRLNIINGNVLEFRFENILLPDSFVNEPASNGYVLFDIKTKKDLPYGTTFENTAEIYFDFNEPIITNTTINTLANPVVVNDLSFPIPAEISPNPGGAASVFIFSLEQPSILDLNLYDLNGKLLRNFLDKERMPSGAHRVNLGSMALPKGVYYLHLKTEEGGRAVRKWVKM